MKRSHQMAWMAVTGLGAMLGFAQVFDTPVAPKATSALPRPSPAIPKPAPLPQAVTVNRNVVVLDAAHGGMDSGSRIGDSILEKDVTLAFAIKLRTLLMARGFTVVMTRDAQADGAPEPASLSLDARAGAANHAQAAACLLLHATGAGNGVHLYASELEPVSVEPALTPWLTAQAAWVTQSRALEATTAGALQHAGIARLSNAASVRPLDSLACPAIIVELAPENDDAASVNEGAYQQHVAESLSNALAGWPPHVQPPMRAPTASALRAAAASSTLSTTATNETGRP